MLKELLLNLLKLVSKITVVNNWCKACKFSDLPLSAYDSSFEHVLNKDAATWNAWREQNKDAYIDLSYSDLSNRDFCGFNFSLANFRGSNLSGTKLTNTDLSYALVVHTQLDEVCLKDANLQGVNLKTAFVKSPSFQR